jgi:Peptidase family M3
MKSALLTLLMLTGLATAVAADVAEPSPLAPAEAIFLDFLDASGAVGAIDSGLYTEFAGRSRESWDASVKDRYSALLKSLAELDVERLSPGDQAALTAMRVTLADWGDPSPAVSNNPADPECKDRDDTKLGYEGLSAALVSCFSEIGSNLKFENDTVDRGSALGLLYDLEEQERRKTLFYAFTPLWQALNASNEPDSPYRRLIQLAAKEEATNGSGVTAAARAIGVTTDEVEEWLVDILKAWREVTGPELVEPWDYRFTMGEANRRLADHFPDGAIVTLDRRFYADLGVDLEALGVVYDIQERPNKSPIAYCDFLVRGRYVDGLWQKTIARVVGNYEDGGLGSLNELVHENGHAVHISAIRNRPAFTDWTDTLFTEAFADVTSWSVYQPAWQQKYLGTKLPVDVNLKGLYGSVIMDVAWSLFELRMLRAPDTDPNQLWTDITREYLHIRPHPELSWWAARVQLASRPGYMVNYGLGAVLTAEMRNTTAAAIGPFDAGNPLWHSWTSGKLLRYGSEKSAKRLMDELLGRPLSPDALLTEIRRIK